MPRDTVQREDPVPNIGPAELLVIFVVALLVFGPNKLPEIGRQVGRAVRELRRWQASLRDEVREVLEPVAGDSRPPTLPPASPEHPVAGPPEPTPDAGGPPGEAREHEGDHDAPAAGPPRPDGRPAVD